VVKTSTGLPPTRHCRPRFARQARNLAMRIVPRRVGQEMIRRGSGGSSVLDEEESHHHGSQQRGPGQRERSAVTTPRNHVFSSGQRELRGNGCSLFRASFRVPARW